MPDAAAQLESTPRSSLHSYLLIGLLLMAIAGTAAMLFSVRSGLDIATQSSHEGREAAARALADTVGLEFGHARQLIIAGAKRPGLIRFLDRGDQAGVQAVVDVIHQDTPYYRAVFATNPALTSFQSTPATLPALPYRDIIAKVLKEQFPYASPPLLSSDGADMIAVVAAPVFSRDQRLVGVLVGEVAFSQIAGAVLRARYGAAGHARLVTASGRILADPHLPVGSEGEPIYRRALQPGDAAPTPNGAGQTDDHTRELLYSRSDGTELVATAVPVGEQDWFVALIQPAHEASARVTGLLLLTLFLILAQLLLTGLAAYTLTIRVTRPIAQVADMATRISDGELSARVGATHFREIAAVGAAINGMADTLIALLQDLEANNRSLEARVSERTAALEQRSDELLQSNRQLDLSLSELRQTQQRLIDISRVAGRAEVASNIIHNVGNVLNSINVSTVLVREQLEGAALKHLVRAVNLLLDNRDDLDRFIRDDKRGRLLPEYLAKSSEQIQSSVSVIQAEIDTVGVHLEHLKHIVATQRQLAKPTDARERVEPAAIIEQAVSVLEHGFEKDGIELVRELEPIEPQLVDKHQLLQIVINLLSNAQHAVAAAAPPDPRVTIRLTQRAQSLVVEVADNGCGIAADDLIKVFRHGFTTRPNGSGFGLHSSANAANEMGGTLRGESPGPGQGAVFTLCVPLADEPAPAHAPE